MNDIFAPNRRMVMLNGMEQDNDYSLSNEMLQRLLNTWGHGVSRDDVDREITWLKDRELVTVEDLGSGVRVATLTRRGLDVATGHARVEGVERPLPE